MAREDYVKDFEKTITENNQITFYSDESRYSYRFVKQYNQIIIEMKCNDVSFAIRFLPKEFSEFSMLVEAMENTI